MASPADSTFSRAALLLGDDALERLRRATILACGIGGVGSWAVEALARCGVGRLVLVDYDAVAISNINRQAFALHSTFGQPKCQAAAQRLKDINPEVEVIGLTDRLTPGNIAGVLEQYRPDAVLDAIDDRHAKLALIMECHRRGTPIVSSMGAANRTRPECVRTTDISQTHSCPMAHIMRKTLRRNGIDHGVTCVWSEEPPILASPGEADAPGLRRPLGTLATVTAVFGFQAAAALLELFIDSKRLTRRGESR